MNSAVFEKKVPGPEVMNRRYAWKVGDHFEVVSRDARTRYRVYVFDGRPLCTCVAGTGDNGRFRPKPCWHAATVLRRLINEGEVS